MPLLTGIAATANIGFNMLWIPNLGMMGAAYATLGAFALLFGLTHLVAQRFYEIPYDYKRVSCVSLLVAGAYLANYFLDFQGIIVPITIKSGILLAFLTGIPLFRIVSFQELGRMKELASFKKPENEWL